MLEWVDGQLEGPLWPGSWNLEFAAGLCWPAVEGGERWNQAPIASGLDLQGAIDLGEVRPEFAAVHLDIADVGDVNEDSPNGGPDLYVQPVTPGDEPGFPDDFSFLAATQFDLHGYLVPGPHWVIYDDSVLGTVEIEQGTTLFARPSSQIIEASWTIDGVPAGDASNGLRLRIRNVDTGVARYYWDPVEFGFNSLPPGRWELVYSGDFVNDGFDGFPDNDAWTLGCVTVEG